MFANKQIVCIEYMEISEDVDREIFWVRFAHFQVVFAELTTPFIARTIGYGSQLR